MHSISYWNGWTHTSTRKRRSCAGSKAGDFCQSELRAILTAKKRTADWVELGSTRYIHDESMPFSAHSCLCAGHREAATVAPKPALPDASYEASDLFSLVTPRGSVRRRGGIVETFPSCFPPLWYVFAVAAPGSTECRGRIVGLPKASLSCGHANSLLSGQTLRSLADGNINHPKVAFPIAVLREVPAQ